MRFDLMAKLAFIAIMAISYDVHSLPAASELPGAPASELKNAFKDVFQLSLRSGAVSITRHGRREAVLLSADLYDKIKAELAATDPLERLREEYDARFTAMQGKKAREGYEKAFHASPAKLGKAAAHQAAKD